MDSIHKTVMVGFPRAFHTDVQNGSKLSKSWVAHTYQSFLLYDRWPACHWAERRQWEKCYPRHARLQWNCFIKSWSVLFAACPEPILRTWPNSDQIHQASVEQERAMCPQGALLWHGVRQLMSGSGKRKEISVLLNFLFVTVLKNITHFVPWEMVMSARFFIDRTATVVTHVDLQ